MTYREESGSLFDVSKEYTLVHCISRDCAMGAGIAKEFVKRFPNLKEVCINVIKQYQLNNFDSKVVCIVAENINKESTLIYNLVTKDRYFWKPTNARIHDCLISLRERCGDQTKLAMPKIASGLDGKDWNKVSAMIQDVFKETDVEILIRTN